MLPERKTESEMIPLKFHLSQNYPNPFKYKTSIKYCVAYKTVVEITVSNSDGYPIKKLVNANQEAGTYEIEFDAEGLNDGEYFYRLKAGNYIMTKKMILFN